MGDVDMRLAALELPAAVLASEHVVVVAEQLELRLIARPPADQRPGHLRGPDGIQQMLEANLSPNPPAPGATGWHIVSNPTIELDGDRATAQVTWALIRRGPAGSG